MNDPRRIRCPAKINLYLKVEEKRSDGFHNIRTIMQAVDLYDEILVEDRSRDISLECDRPGLPVDSSNLCWKAADLLLRRTQTKRGIHISLKKRVPISAGLGGGSTDAAGVLILLNRFLRLGLSDDDLRQLAAELGSDVPFFIKGGTALCTGRGEIVDPIENAYACPYVLITPPIKVPTADVYDSLVNGGESPGDKERIILRAISSQDATQLARNLYNRMQENSSSYMREVEKLKSLLLKYGALGACMSGSGPTIFGIASSLSEAEEIIGAVSKKVSKKVFLHYGMTNAVPTIVS